MGKTKPSPRYNVLSFRVSDEERKMIMGVLCGCESIGDMLRQAVLEKAVLRKRGSV